MDKIMDVEILPEDVAWFHACRSLWVDGDTGAPAIVANGMTLEAFVEAFYADNSPVAERMERVVCAFFLHAAFWPGRYWFRAPLDGRTQISVTGNDIKLLRSTNWKTFAIDNKRPYGDINRFEPEPEDAYAEFGRREQFVFSDEIDFEEERHRKLQFVLQAYLETAALSPGKWLIPDDGWKGFILPRCTPVTSDEMAAYERTMAHIRARSRSDAVYDPVIPRLKASRQLCRVL